MCALDLSGGRFRSAHRAGVLTCRQPSSRARSGSGGGSERPAQDRPLARRVGDPELWPSSRTRAGGREHPRSALARRRVPSSMPLAGCGPRSLAARPATAARGSAPGLARSSRAPSGNSRKPTAGKSASPPGVLRLRASRGRGRGVSSPVAHIEKLAGNQLFRRPCVHSGAKLPGSAGPSASFGKKRTPPAGSRIGRAHV